MIYLTSLVTCLIACPPPAVQPAGQPLGGATFDEPVALTADGAIIDVGKDIGHAGPHLTDFDGDGKIDLLVSSFRGTIEVFKNVGTNEIPAYKTEGKVQAVGGEAADLEFHNW